MEVWSCDEGPGMFLKAAKFWLCCGQDIFSLAKVYLSLPVCVVGGSDLSDDPSGLLWPLILKAAEPLQS